MESISNAEIMELFLLFRTDAQDQFEFWLTITFALIVAVTIGKNYLNKAFALWASALYLTTTSILLIRYIEDLRNVGLYLDEAEVREIVVLNFGTISFFMRLAVFTIGTMAAIWFVYRSSKRSDSDT